MSSGWHWWVVILTVVNILGCWWLIRWSSAQGDDSKAHEDTLDHVWDEDLQERNQPLPRWWLMLFHATIVFSIGYLVLYPGLGNFSGALGWSQQVQYQNQKDAYDDVYAQTFARLADMDWPELAQSEEAQRIGNNLFANNCATCHGSDGGGAPGFPSLKDDAWLYGSEPQTIVSSIRNGRSGVMAPMGAALQGMGVEVEQMVEYVQSLSGLEHDEAMAAKAQPAWAACAACHGPDGTGNQALGAPDLTDDAWLYGPSDEAITKTIREGRMGKMPAHDKLLTDDQIKVLAAYVKSLSGRSS